MNATEQATSIELALNLVREVQLEQPPEPARGTDQLLAALTDAERALEFAVLELQTRPTP